MLLNIFICEFNDTVGQQLIVQSPFQSQDLKENYQISQKDLDQIADFLIPKDNLLEKEIQIEFKEKYYIISYANILKNPKGTYIYLREKYIFNIGIMIFKEDYQIFRFFEVLQKMVAFFTQIEMKNHIIYKNLPQLTNIIISIQHQLNFSNHECYIEYDKEIFLYLAIDQNNIKFLKINLECHNKKCLDNSSVPQLNEKYQYNGKIEFLNKIFDSIDGNSNISQLSSFLNISNKYIKTIFHQMFHQNLIYLYDTFSFSNIYEPTKFLKQFYKKILNMNQQQNEFFCDVVTNQQEIENLRSDIINLINQFQQRIEIGQVIQQNSHLIGRIKFIKLLQNSLKIKILRRIHQYPLQTLSFNKEKEEQLYSFLEDQYKRRNEEITQGLLFQKTQKFKKKIINKSSIDDICASFFISRNELLILFKQLNIYLINK